jgi:nucleotide-binding universal stress UspA family protein
LTEAPLYPKVVAGVEPNERGEDAAVLAELLARTAGGELRTVHVENGSPAEALRGLAEQGEADLIVLGSTHRAGFGVVAPGSVAEHLLTGARSRLAIAPKGYAKARTAAEAEGGGAGAGEGAGLPFIRDELRVVAVGFDGSAESRAALEEAGELARRAGASIRMVAVSAPPPPQLGFASGGPVPTPPRDDLQSRLHDAAAGLPSELRALPLHEKGNVVEKLLEKAAEGVDLLVLGSPGYGPVLRLVAGSVGVRVIREAPCPVLLVPRPGA